MNTDAYLQRIQLPVRPETTLSFLTKLQYRQVIQIPFENLDIIKGVPLSLQIPDLFDKIIAQARGGVCYELNGLFNAFLISLGFDSHLTAGTIYRGDHWGEENTHATLIVRIEGNSYLVDAGFGGNSPRLPIPVSGEEVRDADGYYRVRVHSHPKQPYILEKKEQGDWAMLYRFGTEHWGLDEFADACRHVQYAEDSPFNKAHFLMKVTERGRKTLYGQSLTVFDGFRKTKEHIEADQVEETIKTFFES